MSKTRGRATRTGFWVAPSSRCGRRVPGPPPMATQRREERTLKALRAMPAPVKIGTLTHGFG